VVLLEPLLDWPLELPELLEPLGAGVGVLLEPEAPLEDEPLEEDDGVCELVLPLAPEDAPKWASHSARDTLPSLFLSTAEKLGVVEDAPEVELMPPELEPPDAAEPLEDDWPLVLPLPDMVLEGELDCEEVEPLLLEGVCAEVAPLLLDLSPAANDAPDSARSAAAVALTRTFIFICVLLLRKGWFAD
jgi:hypothetical protein